MQNQVVIPSQTFRRLADFIASEPMYKKSLFCGYAIDWAISYFEKFQTPPPKSINLLPDTNIAEIAQKASDLPGMTAEVIQSHLVRFPKVTPEAYKGIIEELRARQNSEEGLKNPEAAAYGLCKRIQNGQPRTATTPQEQHQAQPAAVPEDNPFAIYEP